MGESNIPMHALIFRCGWETNSIHTIFSYLFTSLSNSTRFGNTLFHWLFKQSNEIYGGNPPKSWRYQNRTWIGEFDCWCTLCPQNAHYGQFKRILAATVLRFHGSFLEVIGNEPSGKYKDPTHHYFHHKIISILSDTKISIQKFHKWQDEVIAGFNENNWLDVAIKKSGQGSAKRYVDSHSVFMIIDEQGEAIGRLH